MDSSLIATVVGLYKWSRTRRRGPPHGTVRASHSRPEESERLVGAILRFKIAAVKRADGVVAIHHDVVAVASGTPLDNSGVRSQPGVTLCAERRQLDAVADLQLVVLHLQESPKQTRGTLRTARPGECE